MPPRARRSLNSMSTGANSIAAANDTTVPAQEESPPPEDLRIDSGREDDDGWMEIRKEGRDHVAKRIQPRRSSRKQLRDRKKQADNGMKKRQPLSNNKAKCAIFETPSIPGGSNLGSVADDNTPIKPRVTTTESRIDSGKEDSHCSSHASSSHSEDAALIEIPNTDGVPIERPAICPSRIRKEGTQQVTKESPATSKPKKRALSTSKSIPAAKKCRRASRVSTPTTPQRSQVSPGDKVKRGNTLGESYVVPHSKEETPPDGGGGKDAAQKLEPKSTSRKKRSGKTPTALPARRLIRPVTAQPIERLTKRAGAAKDGESLLATIAECHSEITRLRSKLRKTEEMLRLETSRAAELEEALGLGAQNNEPTNSEHERLVNSLTERDRELLQREREVAERDEIIREKNAAMRGYVEQIRELEQSQEGKHSVGLEKVRELEEVIAEREVTISRLQTTAKKYETGLKSVVKTNRDMQKKVYSLNKMIRGKADE